MSEVDHGWDSRKSGSGRGVCKCSWATGHYALASDPELDREFDAHLTERLAPSFENAAQDRADAIKARRLAKRETTKQEIEVSQSDSPADRKGN